LENKGDSIIKTETDKAASNRKESHIDLAFKSAVDRSFKDERFMYEPMLSSHLVDAEKFRLNILGKTMAYPIWISSMTGGTEKAKVINLNLATLCGELGLGMGLGSCRQLLYEDTRLAEFDIRDRMGEQPLMINLGVAQVEELIRLRELKRIEELISKLRADGLIIHVNPMQEWLQPEGDSFQVSPIDTVKETLANADYPIIVKEVGQGFGKESLKQLLQLPLEAVDLAGFGGTNFSKLELMRADSLRYNSFKSAYNIGHTCDEMLDWINEFAEDNRIVINAKRIIFSGGIKDFLDGYYLMEKSKLPSIYAQASGFLKHALDYDELLKHAQRQIEGLKMATAFLKLK